MENKKPEYRIVAYTDGASKPSRGCWGCGYFGYIYDIESIGQITKKLPKEIRPTTHGFTSPELYQESPDFYQNAKDVQPCGYLVGSIPGWDISTNNYAEAYALLRFIKTLKTIEDKIIKHVLIFMDSQMLIYVTNDLLSNPSPAFNKYAFPDLYIELHKDLNELMDKGIKFRIKHVYGHKFSFGNNVADRLAFMARLCCEDIVLNNNTEYKYNYEKIIECDPLKDTFWDRPSIKDYLMGKQIYFTQDHLDTILRYYIIDHTKDEEVGERNGDILMGSIYPTIGDPILENMIKKHLSLSPDFGLVFSGELNNIKHHLTSFYQNVSPYYALTKETIKTHLTVVEEYPICRTIKPGSLAVQLLNKFTIHEQILEEYEKYLKNEKIDDLFTFIDLTDLLYKQVKKKDTLKYECIISPKETSIILPYGDKNYPFAFKVDLPHRNYLKKIELSNQINTAMCFRQLGDAIVDYYFILYFKNEDEIVKTIWNNFYSNKIFLEHKK